MKLTYIFPLILALAALLVVGYLGFRWLGTPHNQPMPDEIASVSLGMELRDLLSERADARPFPNVDLDEDSKDKSNQVLMEKIRTSPYFTDVHYFVDSNRLQVVILSGTVPSVEAVIKGENFLDYAIGKWGAPTGFQSVQLGHGIGFFTAPAVVWELDEFVIAASITTESTAHELGYGVLEMKIVGKELLVQDGNVFRPAGLNTQEEDALLSPIKTTVQRLLQSR